MTYIMSCVWLDYMVQYFQHKNCVGSSPKTKKCVASFLVPGDRLGLDAIRVPSSAFSFAFSLAFTAGIFFSPSLQARARSQAASVMSQYQNGKNGIYWYSSKVADQEGEALCIFFWGRVYVWNCRIL